MAKIMHTVRKNATFLSVNLFYRTDHRCIVFYGPLQTAVERSVNFGPAYGGYFLCKVYMHTVQMQSIPVQELPVPQQWRTLSCNSHQCSSNGLRYKTIAACVLAMWRMLVGSSHLRHSNRLCYVATATCILAMEDAKWL